MKKLRLLSLSGLMLFTIKAFSLDHGDFHLEKYSFQNPETAVFKIIPTGTTSSAYRLKGKNAGLFQIRGTEISLSSAGKTFFKKQSSAEITVEAAEGRKVVASHNYILLRDQFIRNRVVAHRGAWKNTKVPQNSIASLQKAIELGCAGTEFDIHMTADSVLVINHDATFEGMTIEKTNYADLLKHTLKNGEKIPTFEAYIRAGMAQQKTALVAELKPSVISKERGQALAVKAMSVIADLKAQAWMTYISFDYDILKKILEIEKTAPVMFLNGNIGPEQLKADGMLGADYHFSVIQKDEKWIEKAHKAGIEVNAWTVNDTLVMDYLLVRDLDYLTTDEPEKAIARISKLLPAKTGWNLIWSDEFNYKGLPDDSKWGYDTGGGGWGNNELQFYTVSDTANVQVGSGTLKITARKQTMENRSFTSARLVTKNKGDWKYGRIDVRARLPRGRGTWPAIWMLPTEWKYGGWPGSGEIDIMEHVGYMPDSLFGTVHTGKLNHTIGTQVSQSIRLSEPYTTFHVYSIEWDADKIDFILDGYTYLSFKNRGTGSGEWPFDQRFHLILNIAVGGNWGGKMGVDESIFPASMEVDYVRVFEKNAR